MKESEFVSLASKRLLELLARATNDAIRTKLRNLHEVCSQLVKEGKGLSVTAVVKRYEERFRDPSEAIAIQTIRNNRTNGNPYQSLYRTWTEVATNIAASAQRAVRVDGGLIGEAEILAIPNQTLRHQVLLLFSQNRSLHNQLNTLKAARTDLPIKVEGRRLGVGNQLALTGAEVDALRDFIDPRKLKAKRLVRTEADALMVTGGEQIADPGFFTALEKIARSYDPG
jgi:hypothetical protein